MNNDVLTEIFSLLPLQSLFTCRAVCKFWRHVIDSPPLRKHHALTFNNENHTVYLQLTFLDDRDSKLSIELLDSHFDGKLLKSYNHHLNDMSPLLEFTKYDNWRNRLVRLVGPVMGLICINFRVSKHSIAICNPFLGQLKILPISPIISTSCRIFFRDVGIGFDEDYKVVQLLSCREHRRLHAQLYSRRTGSWRELAGDGAVLDQELESIRPIKSWCKKGAFAHWLGFRRVGEKKRVAVILSFDMKREAFRAMTMSGDLSSMVRESRNTYDVLAEDGHSFLLFILSKAIDDYRNWETKIVRVYESVCEGSELNWNVVMNVECPNFGKPRRLWRRDCVVLNNFGMGNNVIVCDPRRRKLVTRFRRPERSEIVEYKRSLISV